MIGSFRLTWPLCRIMMEDTNFTIAHEIGHHVLHRDIYLAKVKAEEDLAMCRELTKKPKAEMQADVFAAALLMPSEILEHAVNRCLLNKKLKEVNSLYRGQEFGQSSEGEWTVFERF